ncbi:hypothetical protein BWD42_03710 [Sphingobacterium sp. CZ-UAM]|uniref:hypothetical protein n=1 Tax=Sphingobacterium sp. CZ-UAM TaxID=1933868 RepID=UPI000985BC87|nr:hypothetical protein [Sphingobacterium sp. CZ-UAM]OOG19068.1 hypothetical protein BWD42_03710 [Sphingobacterium sp. CZ-UAM]
MDSTKYILISFRKSHYGSFFPAYEFMWYAFSLKLLYRILRIMLDATVQKDILHELATARIQGVAFRGQIHTTSENTYW